jgi:hypothetical protein
MELRDFRASFKFWLRTSSRMVRLLALAVASAEEPGQRITEFVAQNSDLRRGLNADPNPICLDPQHREGDRAADAHSLARLSAEDKHVILLREQALTK